MKIHKDKRYEGNFLIIDTSTENSILKDSRLNGTEVRFMLWMLSMSESFQYNHEAVSTITGISTKTIVRMVKHLEELGYIRRYKTGEKNKYEYEFFDNPEKNKRR